MSVLLQNPMQWALLGLTVVPLARWLLRLPLSLAAGSPGARLSAIGTLAGMGLIAGVLASGLALGVHIVLPSPEMDLWGAIPRFGDKPVAQQVSALVHRYAPTYVVTLLIAATAAALCQPGVARPGA